MVKTMLKSLIRSFLIIAGILLLGSMVFAATGFRGLETAAGTDKVSGKENSLTKNLQKVKDTKDKGFVFDDVAGMVNADLPAGCKTRTLGYHTMNDGGAGEYSIRKKAAGETEDKGFVVFLRNGNVAELVTSDSVNVHQFGAYGDGIHDDTTAIQNAINTKKPLRF